MNQKRSCKEVTTAKPASGKACMHPSLGQVGIKGYGSLGTPANASAFSGKRQLQSLLNWADMVFIWLCLLRTIWRASGKPSGVPTLHGLPAGRTSPPSEAKAACDAAREAATFLACAKREYLFFSSRLQPRQASRQLCAVPAKFLQGFARDTLG